MMHQRSTKIILRLLHILILWKMVLVDTIGVLLKLGVMNEMHIFFPKVFDNCAVLLHI